MLNELTRYIIAIRDFSNIPDVAVVYPESARELLLPASLTFKDDVLCALSKALKNLPKLRSLFIKHIQHCHCDRMDPKSLSNFNSVLSRISDLRLKFTFANTYEFSDMSDESVDWHSRWNIYMSDLLNKRLPDINWLKPTQKNLTSLALPASMHWD